MHALRTIICCVALATGTTQAAAVQFELDGSRFTLPDGFTLETAAGPPLVDRPICIDFDEQGRLYVAESSGTNDPVEKQLEQRPHRILRLEDRDGDGRFDTRTVFADRMMFPEGTMWLSGSLYVAAPPVIWKLTDTDDDGVAERREPWFDGGTLTGCANDLHGPYRGPDGWIYWCKGAFAEQTHQRPGSDPLVTRAAHIFRRRPEGGPVEAVMTGGMDNPVDVVFTPGGERIFTTTFLVHPGGGQRDGLIHAIYGGVYGKPHGVLDGHPRTGDLMPVMTHLGAAAPAGLERTRSDAWGAEYRGNLFAALFNMRKVTRHVLTGQGATFTTRDEDFLVCDNLDFHPTDVIEDADGSLLVVDTGGWYKLCCPTSQLHKPDVLGAIYRIRRDDADVHDDPRGQRLDWSSPDVDSLAGRLSDDRHVVRRRAGDLLVQHGTAATSAVARVVRQGTSPRDRLAAVWTLARIDNNDASVALRHALQDADPDVRQAAIHAASVRRDQAAIPALVDLLSDGTPHQRRAAAEALGRMARRDVIPALLAAAAQTADRTGEHSLIYALIEINDAPAASRGLEHTDARVQRAALLALDQMQAAAAPSDQVIARLTSDDQPLRNTASWIARRHPEWAAEMVGFFQTQLTNVPHARLEGGELEALLAAFTSADDVQQVMAAALGKSSVSRDAKRAILRALAAGRLKEMPAACAPPVIALLEDADEETARTALSTTRALAFPSATDDPLADTLLRLAADPRKTDAWRLEALSALPGGLKTVDGNSLDLLLAHIAADVELYQRSLAADVLAAARLNEAQLHEIARMIRAVGPLELERVLAAFGRSRDASLAALLLDNLQHNPAVASLPREQFTARFSPFGGDVHQRVEAFYAELDERAGTQREQLDQRLSTLSAGDIRRGQLVFHSEKAACSACHAIGYLGGRIGPDLTRIGGIRSRRDLLESLLFPSASFVRSYESVIVVTHDGRTINGLLHESSASEVVITTSERKEIRLAREEIDQMHPGTVSIMPTGLDQQLTDQELADLLAFLEAAR